MFPSAGLFRDKPCPYYIFGLCERPYCHFKHSKHDESKEKKAAKALSSSTNSSAASEEEKYSLPTSSLQRTLNDIEKTIKKESKALGKTDQKCNSGKASGNLNEGHSTKSSGTPEYNPTPLQVLKKRKIEGKLGRAKYDLALLNGPASEQEYDPASNFSTQYTTRSTDVPEYAKPVVAGSKRKTDTDEEDDTPVAKIPKFVSVEYTPGVTEHEVSDEDPAEDVPFGDQEDWFSDSDEQNSEKDFEGRITKGKKQTLTEVRTKNGPVNEQETENAETSSLPFEFTADGHIKVMPVKTVSAKTKSQASKAKSSVEQKSERKKDSPPKEKRKDNIFSIFNLGDDGAENSKVSSGTGMLEGHRNSRKASSSEKQRSGSTGEHSHHSHKHENHKSTSHSHSDRHRTTDSSKKDSSSSRRKSSESSTDREKVRPKHRDSADSDSKHRTERRHSSDKDKHGSHSSDKDKHSSHSNDKTKHSSHSSDKDKHSSHSREKDKHGSHSRDKDKHGSHGHKTNGHSSKGSHRESSSGSKHGDTASPAGKTHTKKKIIQHLNVDLFGNDSDNESPHEAVEETDEFADLDQFIFDEDPFDECLRIFNEKPTPGPSSSSSKKKKSSETKGPGIVPAIPSKKRVPLKAAGSSRDSKKPKFERPVAKPSPAQVMMNRYKMMQQRALEAQEAEKAKVKQKLAEQKAAGVHTSKPTLQAPATVRMSMSKSGNPLMDKNKKSSPVKKTVAITAKKGVKRQAHTPTVPIEKLKRPMVDIGTSNKVPFNVRQRYLNLIIDECLKLYPDEKTAFKTGKKEEEGVFNRCSNKNIYLNFAVNTIKRLRSEIASKSVKPGSSKTKVSPMKLSHQAMLDGANANKGSFTLHRSGGAVKLQVEDFKGSELYKRLMPYLLSEEQLKSNRYPRSNPEHGGSAVFFGEENKSHKGSTKGYEKVCIRCGKVFEVYPNGKYPKKEECVFHWGKAWKKKICGAIETRYTCCSGDLAADGCQVAKAHVHETNKKENLTGYMKTIPCSPPLDGDYGVYALDCEMVYTNLGVELARVTVVGADQEVAYETFVKPDKPVLDYNTRFSGITEEDLEDVTSTLRDVQAVLLSLFTDKTILMGHSLESDLTALKLIHSTVVDTAIVFPHRMGLPYKRALKTLMVEYLKKIIQDDVSGHDSQEDAVSCLQLMQWKLKEDARKEGRRLISTD